MGIGLLVVLVSELDFKSLGKAVTEVVAGTGLQSLLVVHHTLHGVGLLSAVELLLLGLLAPGNRHCQHIFAEVGIDVQHRLSEVLGFLSGGVDYNADTAPISTYNDILGYTSLKKGPVYRV